VIAVSVALDKSKKINLKSWVLKSGKLKFEDLDKYEQVFSDGLLEVEDFLKKEKVI
ncbi:DNA-binding protein, partial [Klebsiella pneumoniae]